MEYRDLVTETIKQALDLRNRITELTRDKIIMMTRKFEEDNEKYSDLKGARKGKKLTNTSNKSAKAEIFFLFKMYGELEYVPHKDKS